MDAKSAEDQRNGTTDAQRRREVGPVMREANKPDPVVGSKATEQKFSMEKVAELIRVHVSTVSRLMDSGKLGYYQIGRRRVVGATHLEQYLSAAERRAKANPLHQEQ